MQNNTNRFDGKGDIYAKARPGYAPDLSVFFRKNLNISENSKIADIGSGTGIFSEFLINCGYFVYGVEPNTDMRNKAEEKLGNNECFISVNGTDCNTAIEKQSVDCVTAAQAFHWFNSEFFKKECQRILKTNGKVIIVYNTRDENTESNKLLAGIHRKYCPEFQGFSNGMNELKCLEFFDGKCEIFRTDNSRIYDRQGYLNRALSSSYSLCNGEKNYEAYLEELNNLFDRFAVNGSLNVPMFTVAYVGCV